MYNLSDIIPVFPGALEVINIWQCVLFIEDVLYLFCRADIKVTGLDPLLVLSINKQKDIVRKSWLGKKVNEPVIHKLWQGVINEQANLRFNLTNMSGFSLGSSTHGTTVIHYCPFTIFPMELFTYAGQFNIGCRGYKSQPYICQKPIIICYSSHGYHSRCA